MKGPHGAPSLAPEALSALSAHVWPGNVRELRNVLERTVTLAGASRIEAVPRALLRGDAVRLTCLNLTAASDAARLLAGARLLCCRDRIVREVFLWRILVEASEEEAHLHGLRARQRQIGMVRGRESPDAMPALAGELHLCIDALRQLAGLAASTFTPEPQR